MKKLMLFLLPLLLLTTAAKADSPAVNPLDSLKSLPAVKEGFMYDIGQHRGLNILGLEVVNGSFIGKSAIWAPLSVDLAWMGTDGVGGTVTYGLDNLPVSNIPVVQYVQYLHFGYGLGVRTITAPGDNPKSDNRIIDGPVAYVKFKF